MAQSIDEAGTEAVRARVRKAFNTLLAGEQVDRTTLQVFLDKCWEAQFDVHPGFQGRLKELGLLREDGEVEPDVLVASIAFDCELIQRDTPAWTLALPPEPAH